MVLFKKYADLDQWLSGLRAQGKRIGLVPTMGALHSGHAMLVKTSLSEQDITVCSIFVNPTQFNDPEDFRKYPVTPAADLTLLADLGCHAVFMPAPEEIYPGDATVRSYELGPLEQVLEGAFRPGHFNGVAQVVDILLDMIRPDVLVLGQKDYQQCLIIRRLLRQTGKEQTTTLRICPTVREDDGLAMSSRNRRLTDSQRILAGLLYQCLISVQSKQGMSGFDIIRKECAELMEAKGLKPEYIALADARDLSLLEDFTPGVPMVVLIAAWAGEVRLIDNLILENPAAE